MYISEELMRHMNYLSMEPYYSSTRTKKYFKNKDVCRKLCRKKSTLWVDVVRKGMFRKLIINPDEAEVVRLIFNLFISGKKYKEIAAILEDRKIPSPTYSENQLFQNIFLKK